MRPTVSTLADGEGLEILDPIENARFVVRTPTAVDPTPVSATDIHFPVDVVASVETPAFRVPATSIYVHSPTEERLVDTFDPTGDPLAYGGPCVLEVNVAPTKLFVATDGGAAIHREGEDVRIEFSGDAPVQVGVRSLHDRPAATITTTPDPEGAMEALSYLGSALKTTSPERSFPTLRGHPPLVELGEAFDAPAELEPPDTDVRLELPAEYQYVYPATSLAYYLGAEVVPTAEPRLIAGNFDYDLASADGYESTVERILRQSFFLDCLVRTEGFYPIDLHEREAVESRVDLDFAELYDASLADRLEAYLSVPYEAVADHVPEWPLTVDADPNAQSLGAMPFAANALALVRPIDRRRVSALEPSDLITTAIEDFHRAGGSVADVDVLTPEPVETTEHAWIGEGVPIDANKLTVDSLVRSLDVDPDTTIDVHVVCNDERMKAEGVVNEHYGARDLPQFDVSLHYDLTTDELRNLLAEPTDFLHFVSHVNEAGMACADGYLDATELESVGAKAFALNACQSYEQGMALVEAGSLGGVITLDEVANAAATRVGNALARALAAGFSLRQSVGIARRATMSSFMWTTVGNGGITLCQSNGGSPICLEVQERGDARYRTEIRSYATRGYGLGGTINMFLDRIDCRYLAGGKLATFALSESELRGILQNELVPIEYERQLHWSPEFADSHL
ncbi:MULTISPECIES: hypothetical protein [Halorussus]|uniref:hypothetical protein n=1 Tax=Halorussus TaxID=1070314 RepID=UPI00209EF9E7|nr:hypothetical protein [Halorussus vallis]USZ76627.1 hypothetical protein NGM07_04695 [Halorussus vallis]